MFLHLYFGIYAGGEGEILEGFNGFWGSARDVDKAFVDFHFESFATGFIDMGGLYDGKGGAFGRQRNRAGNRGAGADGGVDDLFGGLVNHAVIVGF